MKQDATAAVTSRDSDDDVPDLGQSQRQLLQIAAATNRDSDDDALDLDQSEGQPLQIAAATSRDSDDDTLDLGQPLGHILQSAAAASRDSDDDVLDLGQPLGQILQSAAASNKETEVIDVDMHACKQPPAPYWIQNLELRQQDKEQLTEGDWLTDKHINAFHKMLKQQCPMQNGLQDTLVLAKKMRWHSETTDLLLTWTIYTGCVHQTLVVQMTPLTSTTACLRTQ